MTQHMTLGCAPINLAKGTMGQKLNDNQKRPRQDGDYLDDEDGKEGGPGKKKRMCFPDVSDV
jgi:hypothetical protein